LNKKIKEEKKEEIILINDDASLSEESKKSELYIKKIVQNKSIDKKGKKSKIKKNKEEKKNPVIKDIEIHINNNKLNINNNLSFSSNNEKGNFNQVLFDYKNYVENKVPTKRKKDLDEEELKDIKYQKDLIEKQKKRGWIKKEETQKEKKRKENEKGIKLESYVNESIKDNNNNKDLNNSEISLLSLDKLNNKEDNKEENKKEIKNEIIENDNNNIEKNKEIEKSVEKGNSLDDLLLLDKITDFSHGNDLNKNIINKNIDIEIKDNIKSNKIQSQDGFDLDFNSNVQSKEKSYNFNNNLNSVNKEKISENILEEKDKKLSKYQEYLKFKESKNNDNINNMQNYELEIKTQEDQQTYDEFYKMNHNNKKSTNNNKKKLNNNLIENLPENSRIKKEREKMKGHKCELCQKFYECLNESEDFLCQECSRHRTDQPINKTPKDFYDLNI